MTRTSTRYLQPLHPLHAILLSFPLPLFFGALLSDLAYWSTYQVQWSNFSSWLIAGALLAGAFVLLWSVIDLVRSGPLRTTRHIIYPIVLAAMWVLGFINALEHAKDAWATMPAGLWLSVIVTLLATVAAWIGYSGFRTGEAK